MYSLSICSEISICECNEIYKKINKHIFSFPVTMCIYINREYWPEHSFKLKNYKQKYGLIHYPGH